MNACSEVLYSVVKLYCTKLYCFFWMWHFTQIPWIDISLISDCVSSVNIHNVGEVGTSTLITAASVSMMSVKVFRMLKIGQNLHLYQNAFIFMTGSVVIINTFIITDSILDRWFLTVSWWNRIDNTSSLDYYHFLNGY